MAPIRDLSNISLKANDGLLDPASLGLLEPTALDAPLSEMHASFERNGYLFLRKLLPRADVLTMRRKYFEYLSPSGILAPSSAPVAGIYDASKPASTYPAIGTSRDYPDPQTAGFIARAIAAHKQPWYAHDFSDHPALLAFIARFTGWAQPQRLTRALLRQYIPHSPGIGVHYDQIFLRAGEPTSITCWIPIGDCEVEEGGLMYLEDSVRVGRQLEEEFGKGADEGGLAREEKLSAFNQNMMSNGLLADGAGRYGKVWGRRWLVADFEAGDIVLHSPFMIHASPINESPDNRIRLATDLRFVDASKPWDERWMKFYEADDGL